MRAELPADETTELSRTSRAGVVIDLGRGGGFIVGFEVGVKLFGVSRCWELAPCDWGRGALFGVDGGKMGAG